MTIKDRIRSWLGITEIQRDQLALLNYLRSMDWNLNAKLANLNNKIGVSE